MEYWKIFAKVKKVRNDFHEDPWATILSFVGIKADFIYCNLKIEHKNEKLIPFPSMKIIKLFFKIRMQK